MNLFCSCRIKFHNGIYLICLREKLTIFHCLWSWMFIDQLDFIAWLYSWRSNVLKSGILLYFGWKKANIEPSFLENCGLILLLPLSLFFCNNFWKSVAFLDFKSWFERIAFENSLVIIFHLIFKFLFTHSSNLFILVKFIYYRWPEVIIFSSWKCSDLFIIWRMDWTDKELFNRNLSYLDTAVFFFHLLVLPRIYVIHSCITCLTFFASPCSKQISACIISQVKWTHICNFY